MAQQALAAITPPVNPAPTGSEVAEAATLRHLEAWAQAQLTSKDSEAALERPFKAAPVDVRV